MDFSRKFSGNESFGVDFGAGTHIADNFDQYVLEPVTTKSGSLQNAFDAVREVLSGNYPNHVKALAPSPLRLNFPRILGVVGFFIIALDFQFLGGKVASFFEKSASLANTIVTFVGFCFAGIAIIQNGIEGTVFKIANYFERILGQGQM